MTALCGYVNGDYQYPAACSGGSHCIEWKTPAVFGCTSGTDTILPTTCSEAGANAPTSTEGAVFCNGDFPHCATISLLWHGYYYTQYECTEHTSVTVTIHATPTTTGSASRYTHYLDELPVATATSSQELSSSPSSPTDPGGGLNRAANIGQIVGGAGGGVLAIIGIAKFIQKCMCR